MTGAASLVKNLRLPTTRQKFIQIEVDHQIAALIACVRQQVCMSGNLAARLLQARLHQRFHEARKDRFVCRRRRAVDRFGCGKRVTP
jgi:hypothetical protein